MAIEHAISLGGELPKQLYIPTTASFMKTRTTVRDPGVHVRSKATNSHWLVNSELRKLALNFLPSLHRDQNPPIRKSELPYSH